MQNNEPSWAKRVDALIVLARGVPAWSRTLGRWAYCIACLGNDGKWYRLYPVPLENGKRTIYPFDIIKPFIVKKRDNGRPESCRINPWIIWKAGVIQNSERQHILEKIKEPSSFLHDNSWRNKTLGLIQPTSLQFAVGRAAIVNYFCDYPKCEGHSSTFFDAFQIEEHKRKLITSAEELETMLSHLKEDKLWFIVGTVRRHPQRWIIVETLVELGETVTSLQSWLISQTRVWRETY